jgi:hypothetical protein
MKKSGRKRNEKKYAKNIIDIANRVYIDFSNGIAVHSHVYRSNLECIDMCMAENIVHFVHQDMSEDMLSRTIDILDERRNTNVRIESLE